MSNFIPTYAHPDRMPIDISFVFEDEKPAGKHGFCQVKGDHFYFEDGTKANFYGVICNGAANFPSHEYAESAQKDLPKRVSTMSVSTSLTPSGQRPIYSVLRQDVLSTTQDILTKTVWKGLTTG